MRESSINCNLPGEAGLAEKIIYVAIVIAIIAPVVIWLRRIQRTYDHQKRKLPKWAQRAEDDEDWFNRQY